MNKLKYFFAWSCVCFAACLNVAAADKIKITINHQVIFAYRTADLESAKKEAIAAHKPIAWIAAVPEWIDGYGDISMESSRGATLHAFWVLRNHAIFVFMDAYAENHKVPQPMDGALCYVEPPRLPPMVLLLDPKATEVLATVTYKPNFIKRAHALADALEQIKGKY